MPVQNGHTSALLLHVAISISLYTASYDIVTFRNGLNMHIIFTMLVRIHALVIFQNQNGWNHLGCFEVGKKEMHDRRLSLLRHLF